MDANVFKKFVEECAQYVQKSILFSIPKKKNDAHRQKNMRVRWKILPKFNFMEKKSKEVLAISFFDSSGNTNSKTLEHLRTQSFRHHNFIKALQFRISIQIVLKQSSIHQIDWYYEFHRNMHLTCSFQCPTKFTRGRFNLIDFVEKKLTKNEKKKERTKNWVMKTEFNTNP